MRGMSVCLFAGVAAGRVRRLSSRRWQWLITANANLCCRISPSVEYRMTGNEGSVERCRKIRRHPFVIARSDSGGAVLRWSRPSAPLALYLSQPSTRAPGCLHVGHSSLRGRALPLCRSGPTEPFLLPYPLTGSISSTPNCCAALPPIIRTTISSGTSARASMAIASWAEVVSCCG